MTQAEEARNDDKFGRSYVFFSHILEGEFRADRYEFRWNLTLDADASIDAEELDFRCQFTEQID